MFNMAKVSIKKIFVIIIAFGFGGAGLSILYNSQGDLISVIMGSISIGIAIAIFYKLIEDE